MSQSRSLAITTTHDPATAQPGGKSGASALTTTPARHSHPANLAPGLIAHELTRVVQQGHALSAPMLQRQPDKTQVRVDSTGSTTIKQLTQGGSGSGAVVYDYSARAKNPPKDNDIKKPGLPFDIKLPLLVYPPAVLDPPKVDLFVFFHGMGADYGEDKKKQGSEPIALWTSLKEAVAGTNRIGIAPQAPRTSTVGDVDDPENIGKKKKGWKATTAQWQEALAKVGFDGLVKIALDGLTRDLGLGATPLEPGTIHVAGHSAGGQGIGEATDRGDSAKTYADSVQDVTLQDAGYGFSDAWQHLMDWFLHGSPGKTVRVLVSEAQTKKTRSVLDKWFNVKSIEDYLKKQKESDNFEVASVEVPKPEDQKPRPGGFVLESQLVVKNKTGATQGTMVAFFAPAGGHYAAAAASMGAAAAAGPSTTADFLGEAKPGEYRVISRGSVDVFEDKDLKKRAKRASIEGREAKPEGIKVQVTALELGKPKKASPGFMAQIGDKEWIPLAALAPPTAPMQVQPKRSGSSGGPGEERGASAAGAAAQASIGEVIASPGAPLTSQARGFFEDRFGVSFADVRVHADGKAGESAREIDARAYTVGNHIVFGGGEYEPASSSGRWLLAHELTHVVQQSASLPPVVQREPLPGGTTPHALTAAEIPPVLVFETVQLAGGAGTLLRTEHVQAALDARAGNAELSSAFDDAVRVLAAASFDDQPAAIRAQAAKLIKLLELRFILDPEASSLDLLAPDRARRYREFRWDRLDYPGQNTGEPPGPNESRARAMARDLSKIRPERRANQDNAAVVTEDEFNRRMSRYVVDQLRAVPEQEELMLNRQALESFVRMRDAARADGVELDIRGSYRSPKRARANAQRSGNRVAVADFSSHTLGLAIDFNLSHGTQHYEETTTRPMQNVVDMRQSPAHKWMFLHGAAYGWYPLQNEPWHWEYNPPGFREQFRDELIPE